MPIISPQDLHPINQEEFAKLDYRVMRIAFECQNELGRLCEESIYQNDLVTRTPQWVNLGRHKIQLISLTR